MGLYFMAWSLRYILFSVYSSDCSVALRLSLASSHSHTVMQCHPISDNLRCSSLSRSRLRLILLRQKSWLVFGKWPLWQSWPCQKHPLTNMQVRYLRNTMSGCPGSRGWFSLYLNPLEKRYLRTIISGRVFFERIAAIILLRLSFVTTSITIANLHNSYHIRESYIRNKNGLPRFSAEK